MVHLIHNSALWEWTKVITFCDGLNGQLFDNASTHQLSKSHTIDHTHA